MANKDYKNGKLIEIIREFNHTGATRYEINGINQAIAVPFWRIAENKFNVIPKGSYKFINESGNNYLEITDNTILEQATQFQICYVYSQISSKYIEEFPELSVMVNKYNELVDDATKLFSYLKSVGMTSDTLQLTKVLSQLEPLTTWFMDNDGEIKALPISDLYSKFNLMIDNLKKILADYTESKKEEISGATYTPYVSPEGIITFTNDKNKPNPEPVNIKGPAGTIENVTASVNSNAGVPSVKVTMSGTKENRSFNLEFQNLKGDKPIKGTDYYTPAEKEQFTTETIKLVTAEGTKVVEQVKSIVAGNPATTNALTLSGKTRTEFENDIDTRIKYNSKTEIIVKPETKIEFINKEQTINPSNGELVTLANYSVSDYIDLQDVFGIYRTGSEDKFSLWPYAFYDKDKKIIKYVKETTEYNIVDYNGKKVTWLTLEPSAKYVRVVFEDSRTMFTYYVVRNVKKIASYDVPKLTFDGKDILPQIPNGTNALEKVDSITEYIHQENILNPNKLTDKGYYFDFTDGVKKVEATKILITEEYIPFSNPNIYIRQQGADEIAPNAILLIYCYSEEKYLGYVNCPFENIADTSYKMFLKQGTTKIRLYVNNSRIKSSSICLSSNELENFYPYKEVLKLKDKMFNNIAKIVPENNILNPNLLLNKGYYFDFSDGVKKITSSFVLIYEKYIPFEHSYIYIRQQGADEIAPNAILLIYCYSEEKYLGYVNCPFENISDTSYKMFLKQGTTKIRLYVNDSRIKSNSICLSSNELENFYPYKETLKIEKKYLPEIKFSPFKNKTIANFGDSIFGNKRPPLDVSTALANITGATVYNLGFGGCRMSKHSTNWDAFSMYNLANSIADNNYSMQDSIDITATGLPKYFKETRTLLKSIDWLKVDIVTIAYGTNDFTAGVNLDSDINKSDTTTFAGALRYSIEKLLGKYPHLKIFICTPTYRFWIGSQNEFIEDSDTKVMNGVKLTDFVAKVKEVAKEYHLTSIDNYYELGINKFNRSKWFPVNDGTHHNPDGGVLLAEHIAKELF